MEVRFIRIEEPGQDELAQEIFGVCPEARWIGTTRKVEDIVLSHFRVWQNRDPTPIVRLWEQNLQFFERLYERSRGRGLFLLLSVDNRSAIEVAAFARILGREANPDLRPR